jgi:hypothetical protein
MPLDSSKQELLTSTFVVTRYFIILGLIFFLHISCCAALTALNSSEVIEKGVEVVVADNKPLGLFYEVWQRLSHPYPLRFSFGSFPAGTCFRHGFGISSLSKDLLLYLG